MGIHILAPRQQVNTHDAPDTDAAAASLHHTLGTTATEAAAGDHGPHVLAALGVYGIGRDGAVDMDGVNAYSFAGLAGSTYTLNRDVEAASLRVRAGVTLKPAGYRVYVNGTLTNEGTITVRGGDAVGINFGLGGGGLGTLKTGTNGGTGSAGGNGVNGVAMVDVIGGVGGAGGASGGGANGGAGGADNRTPTTKAKAYTWFVPMLWGQIDGQSGGAIYFAGGSGGGGGGCTSPAVTGGGGGGGGAGGSAILAARHIVNSGTITAAGGNGADGFLIAATTGSGGGGGGGGGILSLVYETLTGAGTVTVAGGIPGAGAGTGAVGVVGAVGALLSLPV